MKDTKKQTAVEWLFKELDNVLELYPSEWQTIEKAVDKAKAMEREKIEEAKTEGYKLAKEIYKIQ
jgi:hypothetical protein